MFINGLPLVSPIGTDCYTSLTKNNEMYMSTFCTIYSKTVSKEMEEKSINKLEYIIINLPGMSCIG